MKSFVIGGVVTTVALFGAAALLPTEALGTMMLWISEDTEYASGYSHAAFDSIELGADEAAVREALGVPIREYESVPSENWFYLMNPPNRDFKRREDLRGTETYTSLQFDDNGLFVDLFCQMVFQGDPDQTFVEPQGIGRFFAGYEFTTISSPFNNGLNTLQLSEEDIEDKDICCLNLQLALDLYKREQEKIEKGESSVDL